jgi:FAD/FMN-containing dehydrogenase
MYGNGLVAAALEYLDAGTLALAGATFPGGVPDGAGFLVIAEADGTAEEARRLCEEMTDVLEGDAIRVVHPEPQSLWRWRDGVSIAVTAALGGKVSEDIVVPVDRLADAIDATVAIGARHGLEAVSWGHGGDGNLHSTFLLSRQDHGALEKAERAADDLFTLAIELGGSISGEHGLGVVKRGHGGWSPRITALHAAIKQALDPRGLFNPGKKL